jgi:hypothetical protein
MIRSDRYMHSGRVAAAARRATACGARDDCGDSISAAVAALDVAETRSEERSIRALIDLIVSVEIDSAIHTWEQATAPDARRAARRELAHVRIWGNSLTRTAGISQRARTVR